MLVLNVASKSHLILSMSQSSVCFLLIRRSSVFFSLVLLLISSVRGSKMHLAPPCSKTYIILTLTGKLLWCKDFSLLACTICHSSECVSRVVYAVIT